MQKKYTQTKKIGDPQSDQMDGDFRAAGRVTNRFGAIRSTKVNFRLIVRVLFVCCCFLLLAPLLKGEAQASQWMPAWVDLGGSGVIHGVGINGYPSDKIKPAMTITNQEPIKPEKLTAIQQFLSPLPEAFSSNQILAAGWTTIFSDDLEGTFPGEWNVFDNDGSVNGVYFWEKENCRPYAGSYSAWVVGGGADGSSLTCSNEYPSNTNSWMIYGPFSLEEATDAEFIFMYWLNSEYDYDILFAGASINGTNFFGEMTSGSEDWTEKKIDLTDVFDLGNLTGQPAVWVGIAFHSDESLNFTEGAYVDNIEIRQYVEGEPTIPPPTQDFLCFLPLLMKNPQIPAAPVLNTISNADGDGNYTIDWSSSVEATTYTLEEDDNNGFSNPTTAYSGPNTSIAISGREIGTYYYRVRASNTSGSSGWSNIVSVVVTLAPPACPQAGTWSGTTSQGGSISFTVENSPQCQVTSLGMYARNCFNDLLSPITWPGFEFPVIGGSFTTGVYTTYVTGSFGSSTTAEGNFSVKYTRTDRYPFECYSTGTWTAHP